HVRDTVRFADGVRTAAEGGISTFLEIGPHGVLSALTHEILPSVAHAIPALRQDRPEVDQLLHALGTLYSAGHTLNWQAFFAPLGARRVALPTYPFQRQRYWVDPPNPVPLRRESLHRLAWTRISLTWTDNTDSWVLLGDDVHHLATVHAVGLHRDFESLKSSIDLGQSPPDVIVHALGPGDFMSGAHTHTRNILQLLQSWLAEEKLSSSKLIILTQNALAMSPSEPILHLEQAPIWGLLRSAAAEHPDRALAVIDLDSRIESVRALPMAISSGRKQLALRNGSAHVPKLVPIAESPNSPPRRLDPNGTVLITGGTGSLGSAMARHLIDKYGVRNLVLTSRHGPRAQGADVLRLELEAMGASVVIRACDVGDRKSIEELLGSIPQTQPLTGIIHAAGLLDDGILTALNADRMDRVLRPKVDGAWNLHELTQGLRPSLFVLFSSLAGVMGGPGQANYAAANAFLDALAQYRHAQGLAAKSIAWGPWAQSDGMTSQLTASDRARMKRFGVDYLAVQEGLTLFDEGIRHDEPSVVAAHLSAAIVPRENPAVITHDGMPGPSLQQRLAALPDVERENALTEVIRQEVAVVLGHHSTEMIEAGRPLRELGLDSLMAIELRNRLAAVTNQSLPATLLFNHPTPVALARHLRTLLIPEETRPSSSLDAEFDRFENLLAATPLNDTTRAGIATRMAAMFAKWGRLAEAVPDRTFDDQLKDADKEELFALIDREFEDVEFVK
ncbi:MAG TPA: SDR family NAD(P)-dependent oxidoreductase, partial [Polyangium sp.]|nr:SDR family NAD(P)-dependent oxidoreductase [Polyangium sp.]